MDIRSKLYPYPVLSSANDDYTGSSFTFTPNISKARGRSCLTLR